jgi:ABC-2 type transport system permease protein
MSIADQWATISVLWKRDLIRFIRRPSRLIGAFLQPVLFWLMIGGGLTSTFVLKSAGELSYQQYFFPGILVMLVLFASIFGTITVIEDRHEGFLQSVLVAPGSRAALVLGKALGVSSVGMIQALTFLIFAPLAGFSILEINFPALLFFLGFGALALSTFGFALAWWLDSTQGYHAIMMILLLPAWVLSGAMFPLSQDQAVLSWLMRFNPMSYMVDGVRRAFYQVIPNGTMVANDYMTDILVVAIFATLSLLWATIMVNKSK